MNSPHYFSAKALNDEIIARLLKDEYNLWDRSVCFAY